MLKIPISNGSSKFQLPVEVIKLLFVSKKMHLLGLYALLTRDGQFSGHLSRKKIKAMADRLGKSRLTVVRQLAGLKKLGLVEDCGPVWMACGADFFAATCGRSRCHQVSIPGNIVTKKDLQAFALAVIASEQFHRERGKQEKSKTQDDSDGFKADISASYTQQYVNHLGGMCSDKISRTRVSSLRSQAKRRNWIFYTRKQEVSAFGLEQPETGKMVFGRNRCFVELPAVFHRVLSFCSRGVSGSLKHRASLLYGQ